MGTGLDNKTKFFIYRLQTYPRKGLEGRIRLAQSYINRIKRILKPDNEEKSELTIKKKI
jgi:hypothetical protein